MENNEETVVYQDPIGTVENKIIGRIPGRDNKRVVRRVNTTCLAVVSPGQLPTRLT